jgi:hypothetical protein
MAQIRLERSGIDFVVPRPGAIQAASLRPRPVIRIDHSDAPRILPDFNYALSEALLSIRYGVSVVHV